MFYQKLKRLCFERGISVSRMAVDLNMSTTTVSRWKRGVKPQSAQIKKIAEYFEVRVDELLSEAPAMTEPPPTPAATLPDGMVNLIDIIKSQQDTILNLSESVKSLCSPGK